MLKTATPAKTVRRRKEARPSEIIDAAALVFAQFGFAATNLERVAAMADVSKGTIYRYFDDKDVLFAQVIEAKLFDQLDLAQGSPLPVSETAGQTLKQALWFAYSMGKASNISDLVRILILEGDRFADLRQRCIHRVIALASDLARQILDQFDGSGGLKTSAFYHHPAILFFPIMCATALFKELDGTDGFSMDDFVSLQLELICQAIDALAQPRLAT